MYYERLDFIIYILVALVPSGFLTTYVIAIANGHVEAFLPYISDTGTNPPESCIFAQILAFGALLTLIMAYIRYHHLQLIINYTENLDMKKYNIIGFIFGIIASVGVTVVGSFQETNVVEVHFFGAGMTYGGLFFYTLTQTGLSKKFSPILRSNKKSYYLRIKLLILCFIFSFMFSIFSTISRSKFNGKDMRKWQPTDAGYTEHIISTISEWLLTFCLMGLLVSFASDFRRIKVAYPSVHDPKLDTQAQVGNSNPVYQTF